MSRLPAVLIKNRQQVVCTLSLNDSTLVFWRAPLASFVSNLIMILSVYAWKRANTIIWCIISLQYDNNYSFSNVKTIIQCKQVCLVFVLFWFSSFYFSIFQITPQPGIPSDQNSFPNKSKSYKFSLRVYCYYFFHNLLIIDGTIHQIVFVYFDLNFTI